MFKLKIFHLMVLYTALDLDGLLIIGYSMLSFRYFPKVYCLNIFYPSIPLLWTASNLLLTGMLYPIAAEGDLISLDLAFWEITKLRPDVNLLSVGATSWLRTLALFLYNYNYLMLLIADVPVPDYILAFLNLLISYDWFHPLMCEL